ncbi:MAG: hypothetical protein WCR30_04135 [Clostridia bacterium]
MFKYNFGKKYTNMNTLIFNFFVSKTTFSSFNGSEKIIFFKFASA